MIVLYKGRRGCGKTLTMLKDGLKYYSAGYNILRNFNCSFGEYISNEEILALDKNSDIDNCVLMIDEMQIFFDSRRSMQKTSINFSNFIQQIRKRNIILLCTTQYSNTIDLRLKQHLDIIAYPNYNKEFSVCEVLYIDLTSIEDNLLTNRNSEPASIKVVYYAQPLFKIYNTNQMIR
jgi:hypothetical protein